MTDQLIGAHNAHNDLHSEQGARPGEHPGRCANPIIKVRDVAWLEFQKPDLVKQHVSRNYGELIDSVSACWRISGRPGKLSWKIFPSN